MEGGGVVVWAGLLLESEKAGESPGHLVYQTLRIGLLESGLSDSVNGETDPWNWIVVIRHARSRGLDIWASRLAGEDRKVPPDIWSWQQLLPSILKFHWPASCPDAVLHLTQHSVEGDRSIHTHTYTFSDLHIKSKRHSFQTHIHMPKVPN